MPSGNVVKWKHKKDLYIVADSDYNYTENQYDRISMIPFKGENVSVHVSRKNPFTKEVRDCECACACDYFCDCETKTVVNEELSIDNIEFVADDVDSFIRSKINKLIYE